jgi:hypothetical protein
MKYVRWLKGIVVHFRPFNDLKLTPNLSGMDSKMSSQHWIYWHGIRRKKNIISISHLSLILAKDLAISYTL